MSSTAAGACSNNIASEKSCVEAIKVSHLWKSILVLHQELESFAHEPIADEPNLVGNCNNRNYTCIYFLKTSEDHLSISLIL